MKEVTTFEISEIKRINSMICSLYDIEVPLQNRLLNFISELHSIIYTDRTSIIFFRKQHNGEYAIHSSISVNFDTSKKMLKEYDSFHEQHKETLPFLDSRESVLFSANAFFKKKKEKKKSYWTGYLLPTDNLYAIEGNVQLAHDKLRCAFSLYRDNDGRDFGEKDVAIMSLVQPHLSNLLWYYGDKDDNTDFFFILENFECVGFATYDDQYNVITCNDIYNDLVHQPVYDDEDNELPNHTIETIDKMCTELKANFSPEDANDSIEGKVPGAPYYVVLSMSKATPNVKEHFTCMVYDLSYIYNDDVNNLDLEKDMTPGEYDILKDVLAGYTNEEIAAERGLKLSAIQKALTSLHKKLQIGWNEDEDE